MSPTSAESVTPQPASFEIPKGIDVANLRLAAATDDRVIVRVPGTDYQLYLVPTVPAASLQPNVGKRVRGIVEARALRMHNSRGGGIFIEPVIGAPRIVQGRAIAVDTAQNRVLMNLVVPIWVTMHEGQHVSDIRLDKLLNFYVETGATFTLAARGSF